MFRTAFPPIYGFSFLEVPLMHFMTRDQSSVQHKQAAATVNLSGRVVQARVAEAAILQETVNTEEWNM